MSPDTSPSLEQSMSDPGNTVLPPGEGEAPQKPLVEQVCSRDVVRMCLRMRVRGLSD